MGKLILACFGIVVLWTAMFGLIILGNHMFAPKEVIYNCQLSEISPDYPIEVREGCRKLKANSL